MVLRFNDDDNKANYTFENTNCFQLHEHGTLLNPCLCLVTRRTAPMIKFIYNPLAKTATIMMPGKAKLDREVEKALKDGLYWAKAKLTFEQHEVEKLQQVDTIAGAYQTFRQQKTVSGIAETDIPTFEKFLRTQVIQP